MGRKTDKVEERMTTDVFNQRDKIAAPPFVTVAIKDEETRRRVFNIWAKLEKCGMDEKSSIFSSELELLNAFVLRKGTQLRLEKALMLTRRILTLVLRWKSNACWSDFCKFKDAFQSDDAKLKPKQKVEKRQTKKTDRVKGNMQEIRLPSRQWANWVIYLTLRDLLLLSKIKYECEGTVGYWLGMLSCAHHPSDSLIIVGILSRIWAVSSGMVEEYANQVYPSLCFTSSLLSPTKADNWLQDIDFPNDLFAWLEKILGFPFSPASIGGVEHVFEEESTGRRSNSNKKSRMDKILNRGKRSSGQDKQMLPTEDISFSASAHDVSFSTDKDLEEEDMGVPVTKPEPSAGSTRKAKPKKKQRKALAKQSKKKKKKVCLDEKWTKFFKNFKVKLKSDLGRKQLLNRTIKYKKTEVNPKIKQKLVKVKKFLNGNEQDKLLIFIPKFKRILSKTLS